jgi:dGTPase
MADNDREMKAFLTANLYRSEAVMSVMRDAEGVVRELFGIYLADPRAMPEGWREGLDRAPEPVKARYAADFLAGMTDTYALKEHRRLFDHTPELG